MTSTTRRTAGRTPGRTTARAAAAAVLTGAAILTVAVPQAGADTGTAAPPAVTAGTLAAAHDAATDSATLSTLARFFAREGAVTRSAAAPRIQGAAVPVRTLSPDFVAGKPGAAVCVLDFLALTAVSSDGQKASLWTVPATTGGDNAAVKSGDWQVVNIATGDDEARYAAAGARKLSGGTVFREPQTDAWFVQKGARVLPLDQDAVRAVGAHGTTLAAYRSRVRAAYGDKLPGSGYARSGRAGGYAQGAGPAAGQGLGPAAGPAVGPSAGTAVTAGPAIAAGPGDAVVPTGPAAAGTDLTATSGIAGTGVLLALIFRGITAVRRHRRLSQAPVTGA